MLSKPFNARELVAVANLQVQVGKKRRNMERLFEERTQELRVVTDSELAFTFSANASPGSPVGIFRCTEDGYVMYANQAWYDHVGYPADAEVTNWGDYVREEDQARIRGVWEEFITSDAPSASAEWQWKNGRSGESNPLEAVTLTRSLHKGHSPRRKGWRRQTARLDRLLCRFTSSHSG
jgi:PAS domain-containing protein